MKLYISSYLMIEFFTFVVSFVILKKVNYNLGSEREVKIFRGLIFTFCMYLLSDVIWGLMAYSYIPVVKPIFTLVSELEFILEMLVSYFWFRYVSYTLQKKPSSLAILKFICRIYATLFIFLVLTNRYTGIFFYFDEKEYFWFGKYCDGIIRLTQFLYFGGATLYGAIEFFRAKTSLRRRKCLRVIFFVIPIIFAFFFYYKFDIAILVAPALYTSIMLYFLTVEDTMMYYDRLTGIYNRRRFEKYIEEKMQILGKCSDLTVYCIDIDNFKKINDTYGHFEGDKVLKIIGKILKNMEYRYNIFAARIGGDEFIVTIKTKDLMDIGSLEDYIRTRIDLISEKEDIDYDICISIGSVCCDDKTVMFDEFLKRADRKMYDEKMLHHNSSL